MRGVHQVAHHKAAILHMGGDRRIRKHDDDRRRAVKRVVLRTHHRRVHAGYGMDRFRILYNDHFG